MPTNVSTPLWRCDICLTTHGTDEDRAALCESAGPPPALPESTPLLHVSHGRLHLQPLTATGRVLTDVAPYRPEPGHHTEYDAGAWRISGRDLLPHRAGYAQLQARHLGTAIGLQHLGLGDRTERITEPIVDRLYQGLHLGQVHSAGSGSEPRPRPRPLQWDSRASSVRPMTAPVRELLTLFRAQLRSPRSWSTSSWVEQQRAQHLLASTAGLLHRANGLLTTRDPHDVDAEIRSLQDRWWNGEDVVAPFPYDLVAGVEWTPSKAPRDARDAVAEIGVAWRPRTSATEYLHHLLKETLMVDTRSDTRLFGSTPLVGVGGVKGGTGKSTVASAFALRSAAAGHRVLLLDMDLDDPTLPTLFGLPDGIPVSDDLTRLAPVEVAANLAVLSHGQIPAALLPHRWDAPAASEWLRFLAETLDTTAVDLIVIDLPAGQGPIVHALLTSTGGHGGTLDTLIAIGSPDPYTLPALDRALHLQMHERRNLVVVENLGRITGTTPDGQVVEIRPHGPDDPVRAIAERHQASYAGSLPYAAGWRELAATDEIAALVEQVVAELGATTSPAAA